MTQEVTDTDARLRNLLMSNIKHSLGSEVNQRIIEASDDAKVQLGYAVKFYPYLSKAEVKLKLNNQKVICKLPHKFMGDMIDLYVPSGTRGYCKKLREPCVYPRASLPCLVLKIKGEREYLLVNYYLPDELTGVSPPSNGNLKLSCITGTKECFVEFGYDGLKVNTNKELDFSVGEFEGKENEVNYTLNNTSLDVDAYTKKEVDDFIDKTIMVLGEYE